MEEYLMHMKTLRTQMNEVEDQAAKISVEEQMHLTTVQNLEKDLVCVKNETKRVKQESDSMMKSKGLICSHILEKQQKIASLELDSSNLNQTLDLMQQERSSLSTKLNEKSSYYTKVAEDIGNQLKDQQDWINAQKRSSTSSENSAVEHKSCYETCNAEESLANAMNSLTSKLNAAKAEFDEMIQMKHNLVLENSKIKQSMELVKVKIENFEPELWELDIKKLDEELQALLGDRDEEAEYFQSLQLQIMTLKEISQTIKCSCGEEYKVEVGLCVET